MSEPSEADPIALAGLAAGLPRPLLVGTDVDGTLAPIAPTPTDARLAPGAVDALLALRSDDVFVAVVSGRPLAELTEHFGLPGELVLVGSHGAEMDGASAPTSSELERREHVLAVLAAVASRFPGAWVEDKPFGGVLHTRRVPDDLGELALAEARRIGEELPGTRVLDGHAVVEVSVRHASKDLAVADLRRSRAAEGLVFIGDDVADEAVFAACAHEGPARAIGVRVGPGPTHASFRLRDPEDVVVFLASLAERLRTS